ncbi:hypothetical protein Tco_0273015 [Tanacetum coccineum]
MNEEQRLRLPRYEGLQDNGMKRKDKSASKKKYDQYLKNQGNYKISNFKGMSYNDIRPIFEKVWDFNQNIEPMDAEHGSEKQKSPAKEKSSEKVVEEKVDTQEELKEVVKEPGAREKKGDGSSKNYKILSEMLEDFNRLDVEELYRLVKERYNASRPEGFDLMLWGDLHTLFEPDEDDEIWKDQHELQEEISFSEEMILLDDEEKLEVDHAESQAMNSRFIRISSAEVKNVERIISKRRD